MKRIFFPIAAVVWLLSAITASSMLLRYKSTPGPTVAAPLQWPAESSIQRAAGQPTLLVLAHPHCPCTRATLGELALLIASCHGQLKARVLFFKPADFPESWAHTDQWRSAAAIPETEVQCDIDGKEARRFHAETSGQALLYDARGVLLFSGGITALRGHSGDNPGRTAIVALLNNQPPPQTKTPVFGCSLLGPNLTGQANLKPRTTTSHD